MIYDPCSARRSVRSSRRLSVLLSEAVSLTTFSRRTELRSKITMEQTAATLNPTNAITWS